MSFHTREIQTTKVIKNDVAVIVCDFCKKELVDQIGSQEADWGKDFKFKSGWLNVLEYLDPVITKDYCSQECLISDFTKQVPKERKEIESQLREQIAKEIEVSDNSPFPCDCSYKAAAIARGQK